MRATSVELICPLKIVETLELRTASSRRSFARCRVVTPAHARAELSQPIQCCFVGLVGVATMLIAGGLIPHARVRRLALLGLGGAYTLAFAAWRTGGLWQGGRDPADTTPVLYLPPSPDRS